jgi:hypothetical protein
MDELALQLAESEISLGLALIKAGNSCLAAPGSAEASQRAEASYLRARKLLLDVPGDVKLRAMEQLATLRQKIDELAEHAASQPRSSSTWQNIHLPRRRVA